jgi:pre-rRNA-processing protein TSR1
MRRDVQKNKNKQKLELKNKKTKEKANLYSSNDAYMNITSISLNKIPVELDLKLPYNFILRDATQLSNHEITYLCRASDLLILSITSTVVDADMISLIKRAMPTVIITYDRKLKNVAKAISKTFGSAKIIEFSMINMILQKVETSNTNIAMVRPYMIPRTVTVENDYVIVQGFMKNPLKSDKVVINGIHEGIIEQIMFDGMTIEGSSLNMEENEDLLDKTFLEKQNQTKEDQEVSEANNVDESVEEVSLEDNEMEYDLIDPIEEPEIDLISKYSEYRGIRNLATCTFHDQVDPEHYKDIVFMKNTKYALSKINSNIHLIPKNKSVTLKIKIFEPIQESIFVLFNLFGFETRKTIHNFDFTSPTPLPEIITVDNGFRIFNTKAFVTRNLNNNLFKLESSLTDGVVSFIGPFNFFDTTAFLLSEGLNTLKAIRLLNGKTQDRIFFESKSLKGKPIKICKSYVVVEGMFFNKDQVEYFRNIQVASKNDISGFIKKPLGTKGLFKAYFSQQVKHGEFITMTLYKRIYL